MGVELKANELRTYAVQNRAEITCRVRSDGQVCQVKANGLIHIPGISGPPPYNIDEVIARSDEFVLTGPDRKTRTVSREEMGELVKSRPAAKPAAKKE